MNQTIPVITIDGPSASGKGTISAQIAANLGWHMLDSGALYRLVAYAVIEKGLEKDGTLSDTGAVQMIAANLDVRFVSENSGVDRRILLAGEDVSDAIRTEQVGNMASKVAAIPEVREALLDRQRQFQQSPGLVADGRDMGTVVFPQAQLKIFLTASAEERAKRRYNQLMEKGIDVNMRDLFEEISDRDRRDSQRANSPLVSASDAVEVDTTEMTIHEVVDHVLSLYRGLQD